MSSQKITGIGITLLIIILFIFIDPFFLFKQEYDLIPLISQWDIYFITVFLPLSVLFGMFFNSAGRAINPQNKQFVDTASVIVILAIMAGFWFFVTNIFLIPQIEHLLYSNISPNPSSDTFFLLFIIASAIGLPLVCISIASPAKTSTAIESFFK